MSLRSVTGAIGVALLSLALAPGISAAKPGQLDPSYGADPFGFGALDANAFPAGLDEFAALGLTPGGKIIIAGDTAVAGSRDFALGRLRRNGMLDSSYGDPVNHVSVGEIFGDDDVNDIAVTPNGRTFLVAESHNVIDRFGVAKLKPGGSLDSNFSGDGRQTTAIGSGASAQAVAIGKGGRIVVVGRGQVGGKFTFAVVRYLPGGSPDPAFGGGDGIATKTIGTSAQAFDVAMQRDGRIVLAGVALNGSGNGSFAVARFRANGTLDPSFGSGGVTKLKVGKSSIALGLAIDSRRRIVLAGSGGSGLGSGVLVRLTPRGRRDHSFGGGDGVARGPRGLKFTVFTDLAIQRNRKIVVTGLGGDVPGLAGEPWAELPARPANRRRLPVGAHASSSSGDPFSPWRRSSFSTTAGSSSACRSSPRRERRR